MNGVIPYFAIWFESHIATKVHDHASVVLYYTYTCRRVIIPKTHLNYLVISFEPSFYHRTNNYVIGFHNVSTDGCCFLFLAMPYYPLAQAAYSRYKLDNSCKCLTSSTMHGVKCINYHISMYHISMYHVLIHKHLAPDKLLILHQMRFIAGDPRALSIHHIMTGKSFIWDNTNSSL